MDVICPRHAPIYGARPGDLFLLDLDSEAFTAGNELVVIHGPTHEDASWLGTFQVVTKTVFAAAELTDMLSRMIFASRIALAHLAVSAVLRRARSAGVPGSVEKPRAANFS